MIKIETTTETIESKGGLILAGKAAMKAGIGAIKSLIAKNAGVIIASLFSLMVGALGLQRVLGLGSYKTAWTWLHKIRRAMVRPDRDRLFGRVEVDETYIGGPGIGGKRGRGAENKALAVIAVETNDKSVGRIRIGIVPDVSRESLHGFIQESVEAGSTVITDGWLGYSGIETIGYHHEITQNHDEDMLLPHVHTVISLMKRWVMGTLQGSCSQERMQYYFDEYTFRFNRRTSKSRGMLFYRLIQNAVQQEPVTYQNIIARQ